MSPLAAPFVSGCRSFHFCRRGRPARRPSAPLPGGDLNLTCNCRPAAMASASCKQTRIIVLEPDLAKFVRRFQRDVILVNGAGAQRRKPHVVGVGTQFGTEMFLRRTPNFFRRKLHVRSIKKAVNKAFYSPSHKIGFCRRFARVLALVKQHPPVPKPPADSNCSQRIPFRLKIKQLVSNNLNTIMANAARFGCHDSVKLCERHLLVRVFYANAPEDSRTTY